MAEFRVGDKVWFKQDIEGRGVVVEVQEERSLMGRYNVYAIASRGKRDCSRWHPMAEMSWKHNCTIVWVDQDHVWAD